MKGWEAIDDRLNPVWVKEVRQSLTGRYFRGVFLFLVLGSVVAGLGVLAVSRSVTLGRELFFVFYGALLFGLLGPLPFTVFFGGAGSPADPTRELLLLTRLRPWQIVAGRMLGVATLEALMLAAFLPFLALASTGPGLDLVSAALLVGVGALAGLLATACTLGLSMASESRVLRLLAGSGLAVGALSAWSAGLVLAEQVLRSPQRLSDFGFWVGVGMLVLSLGVAAAYGLGVAAAALSHPEENRSTALRALTLVLALVALTLATWGAAIGTPTFEVVLYIEAIVLVGLAVPCAFFASEPARLGRRVGRSVPRGRVAALLAAPLLPGGGRGALFTTGLMGVFGAGAGLLAGVLESDARLFEAGVLTAAWGCAVVLLPTTALARFGRTPIARRGIALSVVSFGVALLLVPAVFGGLVGIDAWARFNHPFNPFVTVGEVGRHGFGEDALVGLGLGALGIALSVPRMLRGVGEVMAARRERVRAP